MEQDLPGTNPLPSTICTPVRRNPAAWVCTGLQHPLLKSLPKARGPGTCQILQRAPAIRTRHVRQRWSAWLLFQGRASWFMPEFLALSFLSPCMRCLPCPHPPPLLEQLLIIGRLPLSFIFTFSFAFRNKYTVSTFQGGMSCLCYFQDFGKTL